MTPHYDLKQQEKKMVFWGLGLVGGGRVSQTFLSYIGGGGSSMFFQRDCEGGGARQNFCLPHENVTAPHPLT